MVAHPRPEPVDLDGQRGDDRDLADPNGGVPFCNTGGSALLGGQQLPEIAVPVLDVATSGPLERAGEDGDAEPGGLVRVGSPREQLKCLRSVQVRKGLQGNGKVLARRGVLRSRG